MKILNGTNSILSVFLVFLSLIFNSCSSLTNLDKKNTNLVSGKFILATEEVYLNGFLEILKIEDVFLLKIGTINSKNEYKIKFSEKKLVLSEKESEFLSNKIDFNLMDINFFKIFSWIFEPCNEKVCQKLNIENLSIKRTLKNDSTLIEIKNIQNLLTIKLILR